MTLIELLELVAPYSIQLTVFFCALPLVSFIYGILIGKRRGQLSPYKFGYTALIYLSAIPGVFAAVITGYTLFFIQSNLLMVNFVIYLLPIISTFVTLVIISKSVDLEYIPGFDRILGLLTLLGITFILALMIVKTRIWFLFGGSLSSLVVIVVFLFLLLKWATYMLFRGKKEPSREPPSFPKAYTSDY
jgi:hypothetical protein